MWKGLRTSVIVATELEVLLDPKSTKDCGQNGLLWDIVSQCGLEKSWVRDSVYNIGPRKKVKKLENSMEMVKLTTFHKTRAEAQLVG